MSEIEQLQAENITLLKELSALKIQLFMERQKNAKAMKQALEYLQDNQRLIADNERHAYVMEYNAFIERFEQIIAEAEQPAQQAPDYAWPTIADYEGAVGFEVNDAFRAAWAMARITNDLFKQMGENT